MLGATRQEEARLAAVQEGIPIAGQVHAHHVDVGRAFRLLAGVGCGQAGGGRADSYKEPCGLAPLKAEKNRAP